MADVSYMPHYKNVSAAMNKWDPVHASVFECRIQLPEVVESAVGNDYLTILPQHIKTIGGLDALQKTAAVGEQKFLGVTVSYAQPILDTTSADLTMSLNLSLRNASDNFILKIFKLWGNLNYDMSDGSRGLKQDYVASQINIYQANRDGTIWRQIIFHDVILTSVTNLDTLDYSSTDALELNCGFRSDYWEEELA